MKPNVCSICNKAFALESNLRAHYKTHQNNLLNSNKTIESLVLNNKGKTSNYKNLTKTHQPNLQSMSLSNLSANLNKNLGSNIEAALLPTGEQKLNTILNNNNLLATLNNLNNLDSIKHLFNQPNASKEPTKNNVMNSELFANLLNGTFNQQANLNQTNLNQTNQLNYSQLMPILNSINGLPLNSQSPLTPTDSPTCNSSSSLPWVNKKQITPMDMLQKNKNESMKTLKDNLKSLTGNLIANNLLPQHSNCQTNGTNDNLQQQLMLMATTTAQLLFLKYK